MKAEDGGSLILETHPIRLEEIEEAAGAGDGFLGCLDDSSEEKPQPVLPFPLKTDFLEELIVSFPVLLEMEGEVEKWLAKDSLGTEDEGDEEAAEATVSIEEGVDGLKLDVGEGGFEQWAGVDGIVVDEFFEGAHGFKGEIRWGGDESRVAGAGAADPVLGAFELAGLLGGAAPVGKEPGMDLPEHAEGDRLAF